MSDILDVAREQVLEQGVGLSQEQLVEVLRSPDDRLPELLEQFAEHVSAVGGQVHIANDAAQAREIIGQLCFNAASRLPRGERMVVTKSKSMAGEEIEIKAPVAESALPGQPSFFFENV